VPSPCDQPGKAPFATWVPAPFGKCSDLPHTFGLHSERALPRFSSLYSASPANPREAAPTSDPARGRPKGHEDRRSPARAAGLAIRHDWQSTGEAGKLQGEVPRSCYNSAAGSWPPGESDRSPRNDPLLAHRRLIEAHSHSPVRPLAQALLAASVAESQPVLPRSAQRGTSTSAHRTDQLALLTGPSFGSARRKGVRKSAHWTCSEARKPGLAARAFRIRPV